jgi:hypothetical protein
MKRASTAVAAILFLTLAGPATAQQAIPAPVDERALVREISRLVRDVYVVPEKRPRVVARLEQALAAGRYSSEDPHELVKLISDDMRESSGDGHMYLLHDPAQAAELARPPSAAQGDDYWARRAAKTNHGVTELKILDGNVRYMNLGGFFWIDGGRSKAALDDAMQFLSGGDAIIIDLRSTPGGSPEAVNYVTSHFVEPGKHLIDFQMRDGTTASRAQTGELPAGRLNGKPLYVLTSRNTGSAAEEFAYHVANFRFGELVGQPTAGAAHRNGLFPAGQGFVASVSEGRPIHPVTKGNWEGTGVAPTLTTEAPAALETAHLRALERLAAAEGPERQRLAFLAQSKRARLTPAALSAPAQAYAGRFGERTIAVENGALTYQRQGGPKSRLLPIGGDRFALESDPAVHILLRMEGGRAAALEVLRDDGGRISATRTADS